jgi:hypothetical protein
MRKRSRRDGRQAQPFLGSTNNPSEAYPGIKSLRVTVEQDPSGYYINTTTKRGLAEKRRFYTKNTIPATVKCANPHCQQGGLDLQEIVFSGIRHLGAL